MAGHFIALQLLFNVDQIRRQMTSMAATVLLLAIVTPSNGAYTISPLPTEQSLYFDPIGKAQLIRDKWTLIVYFDMKPYWEGIKTYNQITKYLNKLCDGVNKQSQCDMILSQLNHDYQELEYYNDLLLTQHFNVRTKHARRRRGLVDGIGYAQNFLFGVLDSRFAEQYTKDIENTRSNEKHLINMWKNQTSLIESEFNLMKTMQNTVDEQHKIIEAKLNAFEKNTKSIRDKIQKVSDVQDFTLSAMTGSNLLQGLKRLQEVLLDTITDIYHEQIGLHLLSPQQLRNELHVIISNMDNDLRLPIQNIETDFHYIYRLLKVKARVTDKFVIFEVTFPLISRDEYQLYRLIPIPHKMNDDMVNIVTASEYIAVNLQRDSYFKMTSDELGKCLYHQEAYMCEMAKPILRLESDKNFCENASNQKCRVEKNPCVNKWVELKTTSQFLYFYCKEYPIQIMCNGQVSKEVLNQTGIMRISPECIIKGKDFSLHSRRRLSNEIEVAADIHVPQIDQINHIVNLTFPSEDEVDESDLMTGFTKLAEEIETVKSEGLNVDSLSYHDIHQYTVMYGLLAAFLCGLIAWYMGCIPCRRQRDVQRQRLVSHSIS